MSEGAGITPDVALETPYREIPKAMNEYGDGPHKSAANDKHRQEDISRPDLTQFQLEILAVLDEETAEYGLGIKERLEEYHEEIINHGRLYPNLDELAEQGYIEIGELDKRTNEYRITGAGRDVIRDRTRWLANRLSMTLEPSEDPVAEADD